MGVPVGSCVGVCDGAPVGVCDGAPVGSVGFVGTAVGTWVVARVQQSELHVIKAFEYFICIAERHVCEAIKSESRHATVQS